MRAVAARERYADYGCFVVPLGLLAVAVACAAAIVGFQFPDTRSAAPRVGIGSVGAWLFGYGFLIMHRRRIVRYDPNDEPLSRREEYAAERAVRLADFDDAQALRVRREYKRHTKAVRNPRWAGKSFDVPEPLVVEWWFTPSMMLNGGSTTIELSESESVTVHVPEDTPPGELLDVHPSSRDVIPFQVRVIPMRVHPDEQRLE
jgi:hypothetical protein